MKKPIKLVLGAATLYPVAYMCFFFVFVFSMIFQTQAGHGFQSASDGPPVFFFVLMAMHFLTMLWMFALLFIYIVNIFKNDRVDKDKKVLWAVVIFMGGIIAMPIYWYLYIWRERANDEVQLEIPTTD